MRHIKLQYHNVLRVEVFKESLVWMAVYYFEQHASSRVASNEVIRHIVYYNRG